MTYFDDGAGTLRKALQDGILNKLPGTPNQTGTGSDNWRQTLTDPATATTRNSNCWMSAVDQTGIAFFNTQCTAISRRICAYAKHIGTGVSNTLVATGQGLAVSVSGSNMTITNAASGTDMSSSLTAGNAYILKGFTNTANNGVFICTAATLHTGVFTNASAVTESSNTSAYIKTMSALTFLDNSGNRVIRYPIDWIDHPDIDISILLLDSALPAGITPVPIMDPAFFNKCPSYFENIPVAKLEQWSSGYNSSYTIVGGNMTVTHSGTTATITRAYGSWKHSNLIVGSQLVITGMSNGGNNGTFTLTGVTDTTVTFTNASVVNETSSGYTIRAFGINKCRRWGVTKINQRNYYQFRQNGHPYLEALSTFLDNNSSDPEYKYGITVENGDSGHPLGFVLGNQFVLLGLTSSESVGIDLSGNPSQITGTINLMEYTTWLAASMTSICNNNSVAPQTYTTVDLSPYNTISQPYTAVTTNAGGSLWTASNWSNPPHALTPKVIKHAMLQDSSAISNFYSSGLTFSDSGSITSTVSSSLTITMTIAGDITWGATGTMLDLGAAYSNNMSFDGVNNHVFNLATANQIAIKTYTTAFVISATQGITVSMTANGCLIGTVTTGVLSLACNGNMSIDSHTVSGCMALKAIGAGKIAASSSGTMSINMGTSDFLMTGDGDITVNATMGTTVVSGMLADWKANTSNSNTKVLTLGSVTDTRALDTTTIPTLVAMEGDSTAAQRNILILGDIQLYCSVLVDTQVNYSSNDVVRFLDIRSQIIPPANNAHGWYDNANAVFIVTTYVSFALITAQNHWDTGASLSDLPILNQGLTATMLSSSAEYYVTVPGIKQVKSGVQFFYGTGAAPGGSSGGLDL